MKRGILIKIVIGILIIIAIVFIIFMNKDSINNKNQINISTIGENTNTSNVLENPKVENDINEFNESYLGDYSWENGDNIINFELIKQDDEIYYYLMYYPNGSVHASEELWGIWNTDYKNIELINNENEYAIANYSFNDIKYDYNSIKIDIKAKDIINADLQDYKIPDGEYTFIKQN